MKPCRVYPLEVLADVAAGRLPEADAQAVRRHVAECPECREAVARLTRLQEAMARSETLADREPADEDRRAILDGAAPMVVRPRLRILRGPRFDRHRSLVRVAATAAAAALILAGALYLEWHGSAARGVEMARAIALRGMVLVDGQPTRLRVDEVLRSGHVLRTGSGSRLSLKLVGGAEVQLNENTSLRLSDAADGRTVCRVSEGQAYVRLAASEDAAAGLDVLTPVGVVETSAATFDLKVSPRAVAAAPRRGPSMTLLAAQVPDFLGDVGPRADLRLTVLDGEVSFYPSGDNRPVNVAAGSQLRYDPALVKPTVRNVDAQRYVLWRMADDDVLGVAWKHLPELFAGKSTVLPGYRLRLDYDFLTGRELEHDWRTDDNGWTLYRNALRFRLPGGKELLPDGRQAQVVSKASFVGDVEVAFEVTVEPAAASRVGWAFRCAGETEARPDGAAGIVGQAEVRVGETDGSADVSLAIDGRSVDRQLKPGPGPVFAFGGRLEKNVAYVSLQEADVIARTLPDETQRRLHGRGGPMPLRVVLRAGGPDLFLGKLTVIGRPDPQWLRETLTRLFERQDAE